MITVRKALMLLGMGAIAVMTMTPSAIAAEFKETQSTTYITKQTLTSKSVNNVHNVTVNSCGFTIPSNTLYSSNGTIPIFSKSFSFVKSDSGVVVVDLLNQERLDFGIIEAKLKEKSLIFNSPKQEALRKEFFTACYR